MKLKLFDAALIVAALLFAIAVVRDIEPAPRTCETARPTSKLTAEMKCPAVAAP